MFLKVDGNWSMHAVSSLGPCRIISWNRWLW